MGENDNGSNNKSSENNEWQSGSMERNSLNSQQNNDSIKFDPVTPANFCNSEGYKKNELNMTAKKSQANMLPLHPALGESRYKLSLKNGLDKANGTPFSNA